MKKRLVIDARWIRTGIGRYVMNLLEGLQPPNGFSVHALARKQDAGSLGPLCDGITVVDSPIYGWREQWSVPWAARGADLLHVPHYNVPVLFRGTLLVTIHDLVHLVSPAYSRTLAARMYARPLLAWAARRSCRIVTGSHYSTARIVELLHAPSEKVSVISYGVQPRFRVQDREESRQQVRAALSLDSPYLLFVGNLKPHKNLECLLEGFSRLRARGLDSHDLVLIGDDARWKPRLIETSKELGISEHVRFIAYVGDELLPHIYGAADLLIMPSLIEGFGLPVVEAMACGAPVVCSRASALPEVAGDAAHFFDPQDSADLAQAVERVLGDPARRETLRKRGLERARVFAWEDCARNHRKLYAE